MFRECKTSPGGVTGDEVGRVFTEWVPRVPGGLGGGLQLRAANTQKRKEIKVSFNYCCKVFFIAICGEHQS